MSRPEQFRHSQPRFGQGLKQVRELLGLSQLELALRADCCPRYIAMLESGTRGASMDTLAALSEALNVSMDDLYYQQPQLRREAV
jgi:transcriptional regulator with XRE-family HTH domain